MQKPGSQNIKLAVVSDIHGNSWALDSVLTDIRKRGINEIYDLGDSLYGPLDPKGTFKLIRKNRILSLRGNEDRLIIESIEKKINNETLKFVLNDLNCDALNWLKSLPESRNIYGELLLCHGTPLNDAEYFVEQLDSGYVGIKSKKTLEGLLKTVREKFILCGHSHCQRIVEAGRNIIINPGSVGCPAFDDDIPFYHKMENHSPLARYCILEIAENVKIDMIALSYDFEKPAKKAIENNRYDWAGWIRTGKV